MIAFGAASGRIGMICLDGDELAFWKMSKKAATSKQAAAAYAHTMLERYNPDWVILEDTTKAQRKGANTKALIAGMVEASRQSQANCMVVERPREFRNKYQEAEALMEKYPLLRAIPIARARVYDIEPRRTVVFEAVALAEAAQGRSAIEFATAMG